MNKYKWEVTIKYTRHPYLKDGTQDISKTETTSWFTTIYADTERQAKDVAKVQFVGNKMSCIKIGSIRVTKKEAY